VTVIYFLLKNENTHSVHLVTMVMERSRCRGEGAD